MRIRIFVCATMALVLSAAVGELPGNPQNKAKSDRVADLIKQLGDEKFARREAASKALEKIGEPALAPLRKAVGDSDDAEIRKRAQVVIQVIDEAQKKEKLARLDKFVNETEWLVAGIERGRPGAPDPVPWVFHRDGTVQAGNLWKGTWKADGENAVIVNTGHGDEFRVIFRSAQRFEAFKGDELYRQGSAR